VSQWHAQPHDSVLPAGISQAHEQFFPSAPELVLHSLLRSQEHAPGARVIPEPSTVPAHALEHAADWAGHVAPLLSEQKADEMRPDITSSRQSVAVVQIARLPLPGGMGGMEMDSHALLGGGGWQLPRQETPSRSAQRMLLRFMPRIVIRSGHEP
jgi:hypothetical protein